MTLINPIYLAKDPCTSKATIGTITHAFSDDEILITVPVTNNDSSYKKCFVVYLYRSSETPGSIWYTDIVKKDIAATNTENFVFDSSKTLAYDSEYLGDFYTISVYCECCSIYDWCEDTELVGHKKILFTEEEKKAIKKANEWSINNLICKPVGLSDAQCKYVTWGLYGLAGIFVISIIKDLID